ncbi:Dipeptidyl anminopeptidase [Enhygromyxa salina]|uniref:Dipeptidyl anminopeptidase n=2 Tax=Enhygromyxa salina TaxID=215803 RepID=A0A0C2D0W0_9BACT|nr:Dipeptidyl anminopeptidase [Enhygromyxa salina]
MPLLACVPPTPATPYPTTAPLEGEAAEISEPTSPTTVSFLDRSVDLSPFLEGFPYANFNPKLEHGRMFFMHTGERYVLRSLPLPQAGAAATPLEIDGAEAVCEVDWSTRSLWGVRIHPATNTLWLHADASNDEQMNLWRIDLAAPLAQRVPTQITNADYVYGWGFSEDDGHAQIAYLARTGQQAPYRTCLRLLDAQDPTREGADQEVVCDSPELTFTWSSPHFSPDGQQIYFSAQVQGDRKRVQIVEVDLRNAKNKPPRLAPITDVNVPRSSPDVLEGWAGEHLLYVSNEAGYGDIYSWSRRTRKHKRLTHHTEELLGAASLQVGSTHAVLVAHGTPAGSTLELLDASSGAVLGHAAAPGKIGILDAHDGRAVWTQQAPDKVYEANLASFSKIDGELSLHNDTLIRPSAALESELVRCVPEAVKIPSFDGTLLHAFVLRPKQPLPDGQAIAMVRSFYGGDNEWTRHDHLLCAAGITVVSPAVRGSSGFGKAFAALNDRDLGGDEIVDLFWVARWIETELGIPSARVGVYGRSHGGYATMRAMTFPPETNDRNEAYGFGFGLAEAGFSDIVAFHDATNIPDWVVLEAGDPAVPEDLARLRDRSPINHVERLAAPIFLLHGANDWRVPVAGSRAFVEAAKAAGKSVSYLEVEGQGHHVEGQERIVEAWQARFDFIESVVASTP